MQQPRSWADINTPIQLGADFHPGHGAAWNTGLARYADGSSSSWATGLGELQCLFERAKAAAAGHGPCAGRRHPGPIGETQSLLTSATASLLAGKHLQGWGVKSMHIL